MVNGTRSNGILLILKVLSPSFDLPKVFVIYVGVSLLVLNILQACTTGNNIYSSQKQFTKAVIMSL